MVFPVVGGNQSSGDIITNSLRFNEADAAELTITPGSAGNRRVFTFSCWVKRSGISNRGVLFRTGGSGDSQIFEFIFHQSDYIMLGLATVNVIETNALFRDPSAWYHIVLAIDTTDGTASNRVKLYVNGQQNTSWSVTNLPSQNHDYGIGRASTEHTIGASQDGGDPFEGYMADVHYIDGTQYAASDFGETNDNGVWIPKKFTGSFGSNGFKLEFKQTGTSQNSSGIGADTSGNDNHMAVNNLAAIDVTTDTPTNNFATFNPLVIGLTASGNATQPTFSEGNCKTVTANAGKLGGTSTIMISRGKWYAEFEFDATNNSGNTVESLIGVTDSPQLNANSFGKVGERANDVAYEQTGKKMIGDNRTDYGNTYTTGDIIGVAVDLDNNAIYFSKNGTFQNSGDPTSGASKTGAIALTDPASTVEGGYFLGVGEGTTETSTHLANFGNPPFSISSGNSDANGYGNFEYAVPSGYYALCTKNLAEYG